VRDKTERLGSPQLPRRARSNAEAAEIRRLSRPFWATVVISAVSLVLFVAFLSFTLDRNSVLASERIFSAMFNDRLDYLKAITLEYGYWDQAVDNLVETVDEDWVSENLLDYLQEDLQIEALHVIDGDNQPKFHILADEIATIDLQARYGGALGPLLEQARQTPFNEAPVPVCGLIGTVDGVFLASAVQITGYDTETYHSTDHVLVLSRPIDQSLLTEFEQKYSLPMLRLSAVPPGFWQAGFKVETIGGQDAGYFVWDPALAGLRIMPQLLTGVLLFFVCIFVAARFFMRSATETVRELEAAKLSAEKAQELLVNQARSDPLTGLGNRRLLDETLAELQIQNQPSGLYALLYVDLDRFKPINDTYGHETGDRILQHVARSLENLVRDSETVIRLGGDEFVIVFGEAERDRVLSVGRVIVEQLSRPVDLDGASYSLGASVGIAFSGEPSELLRQADVALYSAKRRGRGQVAVYSADLMDVREQPVKGTTPQESGT